MAGKRVEEGNNMSRAAKTQLLTLLEALQKINQKIERTLVNKQQEMLFQLLVECQECAINIGNKIEQIYGVGLDCVSGLETYCEILYQITQCVDEIEEAKDLAVSLQSQLDMVKADMEVELTEKREVVFLPYKASMWDSLESVWKAAEADEDCDAYVIPIPYYDKNPDGSFREEHYEGDLYPEYVPITRYDEYDFELRRPDVIFIHNPYDNANYATSVHPFFYAKNLKQFTDKLVYIPYFLLTEVTPESKESVDKMGHFCTTPAVIYADRVVVQSEEMRQIYVDVMTQETGENLRVYWENPILVFYSPNILLNFRLFLAS